MLRTASDHADLTFHALAFVPPRLDAPALVHAASVHRPAWMRFAAEHLPPDAVVPIARDAPLLGALTLSAETALAFQRFATLHESIASFLATVRLALADLDPSAVSRPDDLAELRALPQAPIEIFRAALGLAARSFAAVHASTLRPFAERVLAAFAPRWRAFTLELPGVAGLRLHLSATLGPHGRLAGDDLLIGTLTLPDDSGPPDTDTPLALAAHEASVRAAGLVLRARGVPAPWPRIERVALDAAERAYRGTTAESAYTQWRSTISTGGVAPRDEVTLALSAEAANLLASTPAPSEMPGPPIAALAPPELATSTAVAPARPELATATAVAPAPPELATSPAVAPAPPELATSPAVTPAPHELATSPAVAPAPPERATSTAVAPAPPEMPGPPATPASVSSVRR